MYGIEGVMNTADRLRAGIKVLEAEIKEKQRTRSALRLQLIALTAELYVGVVVRDPVVGLRSKVVGVSREGPSHFGGWTFCFDEKGNPVAERRGDGHGKAIEACPLRHGVLSSDTGKLVSGCRHEIEGGGYIMAWGSEISASRWVANTVIGMTEAARDAVHEGS